jgi:hypothetical protein
VGVELKKSSLTAINIFICSETLFYNQTGMQ